MMKRYGSGLAFAVSMAIVLQAQTAVNTDWPQWRGPDRNGISRETGLLKQWPAGGPPLVWRVTNLGPGYGSIAVKGDRIFVQLMTGRQSSVASLDRAKGQIVWSRAVGASSNNDRGNGPRGTPTIDGDRIFVLTESGDLACLRLSDGTPVWQRNMLQEQRGRNITWLVSQSPLIDGNNVVISAGSGLAALDKQTGKTVWTTPALRDEAAYSSIIAADVQGVRTLMTFTATAALGVRASDGKVMFRYPRVANGTANIATPVFSDNKVFFTSGYDTGAALLGLTAQGGEVKAQEIYFTRNMKNHHGGVVLLNGTIYGFDNSILTALDFKTGNVLWRDRSVGKGSLTYADGNLYVLGENNVMGLVEASPSGYREKGRFEIPDSGLESWAHPVVSGGRLYIRNQSSLAAYDVKAK
jgi:outer membrane protein assembly factor BamB